jgi:hypothetical protein
MTKFKFVLDLLNIIDGLFEAGIDGCNVHETRYFLDDLFDTFEEHEGILEEIAYSDMPIEEEVNMNKLQLILNNIDTKEKQLPQQLKHYFHLIENLEDGYILWLDESESVGDFDVL